MPPSNQFAFRVAPSPTAGQRDLDDLEFEEVLVVWGTPYDASLDNGFHQVENRATLGAEDIGNVNLQASGVKKPSVFVDFGRSCYWDFFVAQKLVEGAPG